MPRYWIGRLSTAMMDFASYLDTIVLKSCRRAAHAGSSLFSSFVYVLYVLMSKSGHLNHVKQTHCNLKLLNHGFAGVSRMKRQHGSQHECIVKKILGSVCLSVLISASCPENSLTKKPVRKSARPLRTTRRTPLRYSCTRRTVSLQFAIIRKSSCLSYL